MNRKTPASCALAALLSLAVSGREAKLIGHGWDLSAVRPADVVRNLDAWATMPTDGISLAVAHEPAGAGILVLLLGMRQAAGENTWFDNEAVYPLLKP